MKVFTHTSTYPCEWDDLFTEEGLIITIYTKDYEACEEGDDGLDVGIHLDSDDGVYDIIVDEPEITNEVVERALRKLSEITGNEYEWEQVP